MKVGILGSGVAGQVLAKAFLTEGHQVMLGTRNTSKEEVVKWKKENSSGQVGTFTDTAKFGNILVLATNGRVTEDAIRLAGIENFADKVVIDATNPVPVTSSTISSEQNLVNQFYAAGLIPTKVDISGYITTAFNSSVGGSS